MNVLFICTGNTCRSPMAEGLFKKMLTDNNITDILCSSAGISAFPGDEVSALSAECVKKYDVDISAHRAQTLNDYMLLETDIFVCMSASHKSFLLNYVSEDKIYVLGGGIEDPFGGDRMCYNNCCDQIYEALKGFCQVLIDEVNVIRMDGRHISDIARIEKTCFSKPWREKSIAEQLENENAHFLVAVYHGETVGYIGIHDILGECSITNIAVFEEKRTHGVGTKLLDKALRESILRQDEFMTLEVREGNRTAIDFYKKFGFEKVGQRKNYYDAPTEDAILMTKFLTVKGKTDENTSN